MSNPEGQAQGITSFPLSHSLPNSPLSPPDDGTFSILPRYLLQKVKNTFGAGEASRPSTSRQNTSSTVTNSSAKPAVPDNTSSGSHDAARRPNKPGRNAGPGSAVGQNRLASLRDEASSTVSRNPRLSNVGSVRRTAAPLLSRPLQEPAHSSPYFGTSLSRSHSQALSTLPETSLDYSPPPPYSATHQTSFNTIPGFPLSRDVQDDAKSVSSIGGASLGVTQIFRRLRGEALSRDYWMADEAAVECYDCNTTFTAWRRKHHCRVCGRIFCSRCAWHVIPGAKFGHEGQVRVCNICLALLSHHTGPNAHSVDATHHDRPSLPASSSIANLSISLPLQSSYRTATGATAGLVRSDNSRYNLAHNPSIDDLSQLHPRSRRFSDASFARPETPDMMDESTSPRPQIGALNSPLHITATFGGTSSSSSASPSVPATTPAPFRNRLAEDDNPLLSPPQTHIESETLDPSLSARLNHEALVRGLGISGHPTAAPPASPLHPVTATTTNDGSHEGSTTGVLNSSSGRPATPSAMSYAHHPLALNAVRTRLESRAAEGVFELADIDDNLLADPLYFDNLLRLHENYSDLGTDISLHRAAIAHLRRLLQQCLEQAEIADPQAWEDVLLRLLLKVAKGPAPRVHDGDSMDVRKYIKIKRVAGGVPKDCEYINGTVFTKSMLNKSLPRLLTNPRIMLFDYAFEFEQGETRMSRLDALRESERDSLRKLTNSVIDHRPHIVLVGKSVSGMALEYLHKANIIVARNVKTAPLHAVARCSQAGIFDTYQFFPDATRLGRCSVFRAQTLVHKLIPGGRKTLMRFEGCNKELGATILLRGGDMKTLTKLKRIMKFMSLAAYSVRLELQFLWDEQGSLAIGTNLSRMREYREGENLEGPGSDDDQQEQSGEPLSVAQRKRQKEITQTISRALRPYLVLILSTSPTVFFPPPHSLERLRQDNTRIRKLHSHHREETTIMQHDDFKIHKDLVESYMFHKAEESSYSTSTTMSRSLSEASLLSVNPQTRTKALRLSAQLANASQIAEAESRRNDHLLLWESRVARQQDDFNAVAHQNLAVLQTLICATTHRMCDGPRIVQKFYYDDDQDVTIRSFVEDTVRSASLRCPAKGCEKPRLSHYTTFAHGRKRLRLDIEPRLFPHTAPEHLLMWSVCKVCGGDPAPTGATALSGEAGNFSFAKYLELSFYSDSLVHRGRLCDHNLHSDYRRFFWWQNVSLAFELEDIEVSDVIVPPLQLSVDAWTQLRIKNEEYRAIQKSTTAYWDSVLLRLHSFNRDLLSVDRAESANQALAAFEDRAIEEQRYFGQLLDQAYENAPIGQPSALNTVRVALQAKVVSWEGDFINFEQTFIPSESEKARRATSSHLRRLFSDPNSSVPASPNFTTTFSPLPSVPPSPALPPYSSSDSTPTVALSPEASATSLRSLATKSAPLSPTLSADGLSTDLQLPDIPAFRLTEALATEPSTSLPAFSMISADVDPRITVRSPTTPTADQDSEGDSDSTVCAEPSRPMPFAQRSEDDGRYESEDALMHKPIRTRKPRPMSSIASLVSQFEEHKGIGPSGVSVALRTSLSGGPTRLQSRPSMRRGKSDYSEVKSQRSRQAAADRESILSEGDAPVNASPRLAAFLRSPSRLARPKSPGIARKRPALANAQLGSSSSRSASTLSILGSQSSTAQAMNRSLSHDAAAVQHSSKNAASATADKPLASTATARNASLANARPPSALPVRSSKKLNQLADSQAAVAPNNRVIAMTKHFNHLSRQAELQKQRQLLLSRQRRARPVAIAKASVDIFISSKEALKEDSEDEGSSSGADDEMDGDDDDDKVEAAKQRERPESSTSNNADSDLDLAKVNRYLLSHEASLPKASAYTSTGARVAGSTSESSAGTDSATVGTGTESGASVPPSPMANLGNASLPRYGHLSESEMSSTGTERQMSLMKTISGLWNYRGAEFTPLELPQSKLEHFDAGSRIVVREDEPSSIIAHGLDTQLYKNLMRESQAYALASSSEVFMPDVETGHGGNRSSNWDVLEFNADGGGTDLEDVMKKPIDRHLRLAWDDATLRYSMRVFFADQFDALRKNSGCQELFIESLARCHKWDAQGGKSGSAFLKTKDDRFIIKEISPAEMTALLDFAPKYFQYLTKAYFEDLPTVLAKILGVFRISFKSQSSGRSKRMDVLVMENIYYNKTITSQFDLKGSLRNRMVPLTTDKGCVLLDENLISISHDKAFYVREHTKKHLETALYNDSLFLSSQKIMDYSLIVGIDKSSSEFIVGIIDFLRPYTWDKRLETWVKETAYIGGGVREPTVLNPRIYKNRFREAMSRYFQLVPDRWTSPEAILNGQPLPASAAPAPASKSKASQNVAVNEEQNEQFAGGHSRAHSPTATRKLVPMAALAV